LRARVGKALRPLPATACRAPPVIAASPRQRAGFACWFALARSFRRYLAWGSELPTEERARHVPGRSGRTRNGNRVRGLVQVAQFVEDLIESLALNELHDVVVQAVRLADPVHRHDVGMVQPRRRLRLAFKARQPLVVEQGVRRQHLESNVPSQRYLLRLVDNPHAATADLAQDAVIAQSLQLLPVAAWRWMIAGGLVTGGLELLERHQG